MQKRFMAIWFRHLVTDWLTLRRPALQGSPFALAATVHSRRILTAVNAAAQAQGITAGMTVADARALYGSLAVWEDQPERALRLLNAIGEWNLRYTPFVAIDAPDGLLLDITGCPHLWGGETRYLQDIQQRLGQLGYTIRGAIADTVGTAWALARYGQNTMIAAGGYQREALLPLPPAALRLAPEIRERLHKLGLHQVQDFINMPTDVLRRRFGNELLLRLQQALGMAAEPLVPLQPPAPYLERLPCPEPIVTAAGIEIAIRSLLDTLCLRLRREGKGLRTAILKCYRIDGKCVQAAIGTNRPSHHTDHLFRLFELQIPGIEPALGIEIFTLEAPATEAVTEQQEAIWSGHPGLNDTHITELLDRLAMKMGKDCIRRYLPDEHYWPERAIKPASSLTEQPATPWRTDRPRPVQLLPRPEPVAVTAPIPDYPPMLFIYKGKRHTIKKADGPERIEREWWLDTGEHRDYYQVEDEAGGRYWLFRSGHYSDKQQPQWFIHGFFA